MAETITVTVPQLPALVGSDDEDLIAVWRGDGLGRVSRSKIRGTRVFSGPSAPPTSPSTIVGLDPALDDRWRNTLTGDEWKVTSLDLFTWSPDGNVAGPAGADGTPTPGPAGERGIKGERGEDGRYEIYTAAVPITAQTSVVDLGDGRCAPADPNDEAHRGRLAGFATNGAATNGEVLVLKFGPLLGVSASLPADADLFIADGTGNTLLGGLTDVPPSSGWRQLVGRMTGPTSLMYQPGEPSVIADDGTVLMLSSDGFSSACDLDKGAQAGVTDRYVTPAANAIALAGKASFKGMHSSTAFPWEEVDYNSLATVLDTKFIDGGDSTNAPDNGALHHYFGFGGGNSTSRGAQMVLTSTNGGSLYYRVKSGTSWPAWVSALTSSNINTVNVTPDGGGATTPLNVFLGNTLTALAGKVPFKGMNSGTDFPWETVDYNALSTVLDTKFINGGASTNAPDSAALHHYLGLGGGNTSSRGAQMVASSINGNSSLYFRVKSGTSWPAWAAVLTQANLSAQTITPTGGTAATDLAGLFGRTLTVLDFGAVADAVEVPVVEGNATVGYTVTGFDNAPAFNAAGSWARANGRPVIVPPGRYKASGAAVEWGDVNVYGAGAQIYVPNSGASSNTPPKYKVLFSTPLSDIAAMNLEEEVKVWTGWTRRSRQIQNMPISRAGHYITVSTPWQYHLKRDTDGAHKEVLFGEGFRVIDDTGRLAHTIFGNAKTADWKTDEREHYDKPYYEARKCKSVVTVEGLKITTYRDGNFGTSDGNACDAIVSVQRSFTTLRDVWLDNISGRQVLQGFNVDKCCDIRFYSCHVDGLRQNQTNYGWNIGTAAGVELYGCSERFCRRGVDAHRAKHIKVMGGDYPDGLGAHYAWWMGAIGANIGPAGGSNNAQVFNVSGGGCYLRSCEIVCGPSTTAVARVRDDLFECGDMLAIDDCQITLQNGSGVTDNAFFIMDLTSSPGGFDYNVAATAGMTAETRTIELPRHISLRGNTIEDLDTTGRPVRPYHILKDYTSVNFPSPIDVNMSIHISGNAWKRTLPNSTLSDGTPWLQVYYYKTPTMVGRGVQAFIADMPACNFWTYSSVNPATSDGRIDVEFARIPGRLDVRYGIGSYRRIRADVQDFRPAVLSASNAFTPVGDEVIVSGGIVGGGENYPVAKVAASGGTVKYGATGASANIPVLYRAEGTSTAILADVGQRAGFYGAAGAFKQTLAASPAADLNELKAAFDDLRAKLIATGLFS